MNITQTIFMLKQYARNPLFWKSIGKFWMLTFFFGILLFALQGIIPKLYKTVFDALKWEAHIPFYLIIICFVLLITNTIRIAYKSKTIQWKPWDAFIIASCVYSSQTLEYVKVDSFEFFWNLLESSLVFTFICLACLYFIIKSIYGIITLVKALPKKGTTNSINQQDQDLSLDNINGFNKITDLNKLRELDKLGRFDHAQQISHVINNIEPEKSFAIGINGEWGSGKTSFIHLVRRINQINHPKHCKFVTFNPWYFTGTEKVLIKFHETLLSEVGHFSLSLRSELDRYFKLICAAEKSLWKTNFLQYFQKQADFQSQLKKLKQHFKDLPQKIVIIIDDMDRLQKDEILVLFRTMRLIADFPNVVYLVGYDPKYIRTILDEGTNENKSSFMEKIFQVQFTLPQTMDIHLKAIWNERIQIISDNESLAIELLTNDIFKNKLIDNLRDIKRLFNILEISYSLPEIKANTYFPHFVLIEFIAYKYPNLYQKIKKHKDEITKDKKTRKLFKEETNSTFKNDLDNNESKLFELFFTTEQTAQHSSSPFLTNAQAFDKYFNIRLHPEDDINIKEVEDCLLKNNAKNEFKSFYEKSKDQLISYLDQIFSTSPLFNDNIITAASLKYIIQVFILTYNENYFDYFKKPENDDSKLLTNAAKNILNSELKTFNNKIFEPYYGDISFVYFLGQIAKKDLDINNFPIAGIFKRCLERFIHDKNIDKLIISFHIFHDSSESDRYFHKDFFKEFLKLNQRFLRNNSTEVLKIIESLKKQEFYIGCFFGSFEDLLTLNDFKNKDIFEMLDKYDKYYPVHQEKNSTEFTHSFKYDEHNYRINLPKSTSTLIFKSINGQVIYHLTITDNKINLTYYHDVITRNEQIVLSKPINNYTLSLFRIHNECLFMITDLNNPKNQEDLSKLKNGINSNPHFEYEILISTEKEEEFILERQLIPREMQDQINSINKY